MHGEEQLLRELVSRQLWQVALGDHTEGLAQLDGPTTSWRVVRDELCTRGLFGTGRRVVCVREADDFVSAHRPLLESFLDDPVGEAVLVLCVKSWPGNTRLAKRVAKQGLVVACRAPERKAGKRSVVDHAKLAKWLAERARTTHRLNVSVDQVHRIMEIAGDNLGLLDQELAKLALYVDGSEKPTDELIVQVVGGWRQETTWELIDAACNGESDRALALLDRLLHSGEAPQALFGAISWSLRRFAKAVRLIEATERQGRRANLRDALVAAGFSKFPSQRLDENVDQLRQLGRARAGRILQWLLDTDVRLKRTHSSPDRARWALEGLLLRLSTDHVSA